jgi:multidrug efflux pump subunit AcrB
VTPTGSLGQRTSIWLAVGVRSAGREQAIRTLAGKQSLPDLAATMIALPKGRKVRLDQLGKVSDGVAEPRAFATLDGRPIVAFAISRAKGASDTVVAAEVAEKIADLRRIHPDVEFKQLDSMGSRRHRRSRRRYPAGKGGGTDDGPARRQAAAAAGRDPAVR